MTTLQELKDASDALAAAKVGHDEKWDIWQAASLALGLAEDALAETVTAYLATPPVVVPPPAEDPPVLDPPSTPPSTPPNLKPLAADPIVGTVTKPALGESFADPVYGTKITRRSIGPDRHNYSRRQAENADGSRYITTTGGNWYLHDAKTCAVLRTLTGMAGDCEPIWHATNPRLLLHTGREGKGGIWYWLDVEANARTIAFNLTSNSPFPKAQSYWTKGEGTTSAEGKYLALMAETYNGSTGNVDFYGVIVVDVATGTIVSSRASTQRPDHVSMSPTGRCVVVSCTGSEGTRAYSRDFKSFVQLQKGSQHSDLAIGPEGQDYYVVANYTNGYLEARNCESVSDVFVLSPLYPASGAKYSCHISGQAFDRPGWVVISTYADSDRAGSPAAVLQPQYRKVWLAELKPNGKQYSVCHIRTTGSGYFDEPQATISRDGKRITFASNLGSGPSDSYLVEVP